MPVLKADLAGHIAFNSAALAIPVDRENSSAAFGDCRRNELYLVFSWLDKVPAQLLPRLHFAQLARLYEFANNIKVRQSQIMRHIYF